MIEMLGGAVLTLDTKAAEIKLLDNVTHVVAASDETSEVRPRRFKFIVLAIVKGCVTVNLQWVIESFKEGKFIATDRFRITDSQTGFSLSRSVEIHSIAKASGGLFKGFYFVLCGGVVTKSSSMPHKEGFKLLATLVGASLVSPSAKIEKLPHPEKVIVITNDVKSLAKSAAVAVKRGAQVMTGGQSNGFCERLPCVS